MRVDLPGADYDLLTAYYPQGHYLDSPGATKAEILTANGAEVKVRFSRGATARVQGDPVDVVTEYTLRDGEPFLRLKTTYTNQSAKPANAAVYDKIRADTLFRIPPEGVTESLIYYEPWHHAAYGIVRAGGAPLKSYANPANKTYFEEGGNRLDFPELLTKDAAALPIARTLPLPSMIPAGGSVTVERMLIPGRHPADVQPVIAAILGTKPYPIPVRIVDGKGAPVAGATVRAVDGELTASEGFTDTSGSVVLSVANPARMQIVMTQRGRADVRASASAGRDVQMVAGPMAEAKFDIFDTTQGRKRGPVKVVIRGVNGTQDPAFGPDALPYQAGNICFTPTGVFKVALPPGQYEALIGRGPEYTLEKREFHTAYGEVTPVRAEIRHAFNSTGWIIADFHNHTTNSNDSIADPRGRVVGIAAAGTEFAPATEHNRISTLAPYIESEHLEAFLRSAGGIELSGRPGPGAINHQNAFPLRVQEGVQGGGAPATDRDPKVQISRLFDYDGGAEKFIQHNHPDVGWLYFDKNRDGVIDGGFGTRPYTNAIEINRDIVKLLKDLETPAAHAVRGRGFAWLQMLNQGDRIYGTGTSDAHVTAFNNGSIFTYLKSSTDDPARLDPVEMARSAKAGQMVISNGPFLEVYLNGVLPGGEVKAKGALTMKVRVQCADWIDIDRVQVLVNGRPEKTLNYTRSNSPESFHKSVDPVRFERDILLALQSDSHIIVIATGESSQLGLITATMAVSRQQR